MAAAHDKSYEIDTLTPGNKLGEKIENAKRKINDELEKVVTTLTTKYGGLSAGAIFADTHYPLKQAISKCTTEMDSLDRFLDSTKSELGSTNSAPQQKFVQLKSLVDDLGQLHSLEVENARISSAVHEGSTVEASQLIDEAFSRLQKLSDSSDQRICQLAMVLSREYIQKKKTLELVVKSEVVEVSKPNDEAKENVDDSMDVDQIEADEALARCSKICDRARQLAIENCSEEVAVGHVNDKEGDDSVNNFFAEFDMKLNLNVKTENGQKPVQEYGLPKLFQFRQCRVSKNTKEFVDMIVKVVDEIISTECPATCGKLLEAVYSAVNVYIFTYAKVHDEIIKMVPLFGALFYNGCYYIAHVLMLESMNLQSKVDSCILDGVGLHELVPELRNFAAQILETHLLQLRRQISSIIGTDDIFANLMREGASLDYQKVLTSCLNTIRQVADVWKPVFSEFVYARSAGACISYTLAVLVDVIVCKEDITEKDSQEMKNQLNHLLAGFEQIMEINGEQTIQVFCEKDYYRAKEVIFCLNEPLLVISDRWCSGKGPLAYWMKPDEVKKLIRAVFQNTDLRAKVLAQIV